MLTRQTVIWTARETTYGTDPAMTGTNGILAWDINLDLKGEQLIRDVLRDTLSPISHVIGMKEAELTFKTEVKGIGAAPGTAANLAVYDFDRLISGCSFNTGVINGTSITYSLVSTDSTMNSLSFYVHVGDSSAGNRHKITGARGTVTFNLSAGKYGEASWKFNGLYNSVIAATLPGLTNISALQPPIVYNSSFQIAGFSPVCQEAEIDLGINVTRRESLNATQGVHSFRIVGRKPALKFDSDAVVESSNPFWGDWEGGIVDTFGITIGTNAQNRMDFTGYFEYIQPKYGDDEGVRKYDCEAAIISSNATSGNDEISIKVW